MNEDKEILYEYVIPYEYVMDLLYGATQTKEFRVVAREAFRIMVDNQRVVDAAIGDDLG